jgi:CAAX protease family protein
LWLGLARIVRHGPIGTQFETFEILLIIFGACGPTIGAFATRWLGHRDLKICKVWAGWRSTLVGLGVGLLCFTVATVVAPSIAVASAPVSALHWSQLLHWSVWGVNWSTFTGGPLNEEPGWRGFALPRLQQKYGPYSASVILAIFWAAWHLPLFQIPGWSSATPGQFVLILLGLSFLMTAAANLARFGVLVAIVMHAFFNTSSGLGNALTNGLPTRSHEMWVYTLVVCVCGTVLGVAVLGKSKRPQSCN